MAGTKSDVQQPSSSKATVQHFPSADPIFIPPHCPTFALGPGTYLMTARLLAPSARKLRPPILCITAALLTPALQAQDAGDAPAVSRPHLSNDQLRENGMPGSTAFDLIRLRIHLRCSRGRSVAGTVVRAGKADHGRSFRNAAGPVERDWAAAISGFAELLRGSDRYCH
jgi:hypothetical protein